MVNAENGVLADLRGNLQTEIKDKDNGSENKTLASINWSIINKELPIAKNNEEFQKIVEKAGIKNSKSYSNHRMQATIFMFKTITSHPKFQQFSQTEREEILREAFKSYNDKLKYKLRK